MVIATSPTAEKRVMSIVLVSLLCTIEDGVERRVVVHLHLAVYLHIFASGGNVVEQLAYGGCHILVLLVENVELGLAFGAVLRVDIGAFHLLLHMVYLEREDGVAVDSPSGALGVYGCAFKRCDILVPVEKVAVDELYKVGAVLVRLVDAAFQRECLHGVNSRVAYDVLEMPLYGVYPALEVEVIFNALHRIWIVYWCVYVVGLVIIGNGLVEYGPTQLCKFIHFLSVFVLHLLQGTVISRQI